MKIAILDDYAHAALEVADWSAVQAKAEVVVFDRHLSEDEAADALQDFDVLVTVRERMAEYAKVFGMEVIAWSQNLTPEAAAEVGAKRVDKDALFAQADAISIHLVLSERSRGLVTARELGLMKPTAYLINTSRGPIVEEAALIEALRSRKIAGAGVDVYDTEPPPADHPFRSMDNVTLTPHLGYVTRETLHAFYSDSVEAVLAFLDGHPIRVANPEALERRAAHR